MDPTHLSGNEIDGFHILEQLGQGGMGIVYKAEDVALARTVAIKVLRPNYTSDEAFLERFRREARALARLDHPHIVRIHTLRRSGVGVFIVMEYVGGGTLAGRLKQGPMPVDEALPLIRQMLDALTYAHQAGIVHRDIKPHNIMLTEEASVKVTDFGLAKLQHAARENVTQTQGIMGTVLYMSPEQIAGLGDVDGRSDLFSLGVTVYEMLAGQRPFEGTSEFALMRAIVESPPVPLDHHRPDLPAPLVHAVMRALEKEPAARFQRAEEMLAALDAPGSEPSISVTAAFERPPLSPQSQARPRVAAPRSARPFGGILAAAGALFGSVLAAVFVWPARYALALAKRVGQFVGAMRRPRASTEVPGARPVSTSDRPTVHDVVGFAPYTKAIADFLTHEDTTPPLTLSVEGAWGSGKSSFMLQLRQRLVRDGHLAVWFNAWRHDKEEALWAAFSLEFLRQLKEQRPPWRRWLGHVSLVLRRYTWSQGWFAALRAGAVWVLLASAVVVLPLILYAYGSEGLGAVSAALAASLDTAEGGAWQTLVELAVGTGGVAAGLALLVTVWIKLKAVVGNPLEVDLQQYLDAPDYKSHVAFIESFHADFERIVTAYAGEKKVFVFIDDLDRCGAAKASDLMQALNLMIAEDLRLFFVIGMDREKVAAGLAVRFKEVLPFLARRSTAGAAPSELPHAGLEHGYNFLEKFVQVPFLLPQPGPVNVSSLLDGYALDVRFHPLLQNGHDPARTVPPAPDPLAATAHPFRTTFRMEERLRQKRRVDLDTTTVRQTVMMVSPALDFNLRRVKQFINLFRLQTYVEAELGRFDDPFKKWVTPYQLGKLIAVLLKWPLLLSDLAREPGLLADLHDAALGHRPPGEGADPRLHRWAARGKLVELLRAGCLDEEGLVDAEREQAYGLGGLDVGILLCIAQDVVAAQHLGAAKAP